MTFNLRPLVLGEILDRTAELYRKNFVLFAGLSAVYAGAIMILTLLQLWFTFALKGDPPGAVKIGLLGLFFFVEISAIFVLAGVSMAANTRAVAWVNLGEPATIIGAYKSILPKTGRYVWLMFLIGVRMFLWIILFSVVIGGGVGILAVLARTMGGSAGSSIVVGLVTFVCIVGAMIFTLWILLRYSLAVPASVVEDMKARQAIKRSIELSKGSRGRIFVLFLLIAVIAFALIAVTQFPFLIAVFRHPKQPISLGTQVLQQVLNFFTSTLLGPIYAIGLTLFYFDQRIRKEGFDIVWMMQGAGLTALQASEDESSASEVNETGTVKA